MVVFGSMRLRRLSHVAADAEPDTHMQATAARNTTSVIDLIVMAAPYFEEPFMA
jgi:hypothetical protein